MCTHEHSWVLKSMVLWRHEHLWVLISVMAPWPLAHDCSWALMTAHCSMLPSSWVFMAAHDCSWAIMHTPEYLLALMSTQKQPNTARSAHNYSWGDMNTHDICAMEQWTLEGAQEESWPWGHGHSLPLMSTNCAIAPSSWVLASANKHWYALMRAPERT